ncbi:MAG: tetrahydromethanopterin S-methyltransferase subunit H [Candidatus Thorarchaeota archaeon]|jgi:tetrahydromethanopterin S-methyltransferase subunit H
MFFFEKEQFIYNVGGVRIGGMRGENPTVVAGTIFYDGHKIVKDAKNGVVDKKAAESLIAKQDELSEITGNPSLVHLFSVSKSAVSKYIDIVTENTDAPFLIDSTDASVRIAGLRYAEEIGLLDRAVYNSINISASTDELDELREIQHDCAILLAFNPQDPSIAGKRAVLEEGVLDREKGLLQLVKELGISKPLIDTATTAMDAGAGSSAAFTFVSKTLYGHPTGSGIHNAPSSWTWLRKLKKTNREAFRTTDIASNLLVQVLGADFILYGPIENADRVFPVVAMADIFAAEVSTIEFGIDPVEDHPFRKLL